MRPARKHMPIRLPGETVGPYRYGKPIGLHTTQPLTLTHSCTLGLMCYLFQPFDYIMTHIRGGRGKEGGEERGEDK